MLLLIGYAVVLATGFGLQALNRRSLRRHGTAVPPELRAHIEADALPRIVAYTLAKNRLHACKSAALNAVLALFLFAGGLGAYDSWVGREIGSTPPGSGRFVLGGLLFFLPLVVAETLLEAPFSLYAHFGIEHRFGFNRMNARLWLADELKTLGLSLALGSIVVASVLALVGASPNGWWLAVWGFFLGFSALLLYVAPYVIEPLFSRFQPLNRPDLEDDIRQLVQHAGLQVSRVQKVDASRRSRHSNAYFTGIGRVKRIVLFDTLLEQMQPVEILAVLAHEAGHWKKRHILKRLVLLHSLALVALFAAWHALRWEGLLPLFGLDRASFYARAVLVGFGGSLVAFPLVPLFSFLSRRDEWEADRFAVEITGRPLALANALGRLARENLSNLYPHPLYAAFYYSHPPILQRIRALSADVVGRDGGA